ATGDCRPLRVDMLKDLLLPDLRGDLRADFLQKSLGAGSIGTIGSKLKVFVESFRRSLGSDHLSILRRGLADQEHALLEVRIGQIWVSGNGLVEGSHGLIVRRLVHE